MEVFAEEEEENGEMEEREHGVWAMCVMHESMLGKGSYLHPFDVSFSVNRYLLCEEHLLCLLLSLTRAHDMEVSLKVNAPSPKFSYAEYLYM